MPCQVLSPALTEDGLREVLLGALEGDASGDIPEIHFHILKCRILGRKNHMEYLQKVMDSAQLLQMDWEDMAAVILLLEQQSI